MDEPVRVRTCPVLAVETGGVEVAGADLGSRKARTLLGLLAAERGQHVPVDRVAAVLWGDRPPADPAGNVATLASRLRRVLGRDAVVAGTGTYALSPRCRVDLDEAGLLVAEAVDRIAGQEPALAAAAARRALSVLGRAGALAGEGDHDWVRVVRREADDRRREARHLLVEAAVAEDDLDVAVAVASEAVEADPLDERAVRDLVRARVGLGSTAAALAAYDDLARRLREELGTDPEPRTVALHLRVLREEPLLPEQPPPRPRVPPRPPLLGREEELRALEQAWAAASSGRGGLVVVHGEAGIGKTRLLEAAADLAGATGGLVLRARCRPGERSMFLQPFVDALRPALTGAGSVALPGLLRSHSAAWVSLLPDLADLVEAPWQAPAATPAIESRRAYDAVAAVLRRLGRRRPVLLLVDDLQDAGDATAELVAYLSRVLHGTAVLLVGATRDAAPGSAATLGDGTDIGLGALPPSAVRALVEAAGLPSSFEEVLRRTAGHPLSVVECVRALQAGDAGVPDTLATAVRLRVDRLAPGTRQCVEGAAVLGGVVDARRLAAVVGAEELDAVRECEELVRLRLLNRVGDAYEVVNDLIRDAIHGLLAPALAQALHRRAADVFSDRPETMAEHAHAAGEVERAAHGWWLAGREAMGRSAVSDAVSLLDRALATDAGPSLRVRALLERARCHEAQRAYEAAATDVDLALRLAHEVGEERLEMAAARVGSSDILVALRRPRAEVSDRLEQGLRLAVRLGDRYSESHFAGRVAAVLASDLRLEEAAERARGNLERSRSSGSQDALVLGLDGLKTVLFHLGDGTALEPVVAELVPLLRRRRSTWMLQWATFESAVVPASRGDWDGARSRVEAALALNRRSGYPLYASFFGAYGAWFRRLSGDLDAAVEEGRRALRDAEGSDHPWWSAAACGLLAGSLLAAGSTTEAEQTARLGLAATSAHSARAWRLLCLAPLAVAASDVAAREEATTLLRGVRTPPGAAWVLGSDAYLWCARAWADDDPGVARALLAPLATATGPSWSVVYGQVGGLLGALDAGGQSSSATIRAARRAPSRGTGA